LGTKGAAAACEVMRGLVELADTVFGLDDVIQVEPAGAGPAARMGDDLRLSVLDTEGSLIMYKNI
jgi:hypothetical protein